MTLPTFDAVVVAYGPGGWLRRCVELALAQGAEQVIVVDHGCDSAASLGALGRVRVLPSEGNPGFGTGQNRGVSACSSDLVLLLNPDFLLAPGALDAGRSYLQEHPDVGAVQGIIRGLETGVVERSQGVDLRPIHLWGRALGARRLLGSPAVRAVAARAPRLRDHARRVPSGPARVEWLAATAVLVRRDAFEGVGGFDPRYFLYGEDLDLARRIRERGWALVALDRFWGHHVSGGSSSGAVDREIAWWEGTLLYARRWWSARDRLVASGACIVAACRLAVRAPSRVREIGRRLFAEPS